MFAHKCDPETNTLPKLEDFKEEAKTMTDTKKKRLVEVCSVPEAYVNNLKIMKLSNVETPIVSKKHTFHDINQALDVLELGSLKAWYRKMGWL